VYTSVHEDDSPRPRLALRAGFAVRSGILPPQSEHSRRASWRAQ